MELTMPTEEEKAEILRNFCLAFRDYYFTNKFNCVDETLSSAFVCTKPINDILFEGVGFESKNFIETNNILFKNAFTEYFNSQYVLYERSLRMMQQSALKLRNHELQFPMNLSRKETLHRKLLQRNLELEKSTYRIVAMLIFVLDMARPHLSKIMVKERRSSRKRLKRMYNKYLKDKSVHNEKWAMIMFHVRKENHKQEWNLIMSHISTIS